MPGLHNRFRNSWRLLEQLKNRTPILILILGLLALMAVGIEGAVHVIHETSTEPFCISCHEMEGVYDEYKKSKHYSNAAGIKTECHDCHLPPVHYATDSVGYLKAKAMAVRDIYHHLLGTYPTPDVFDRDRLSMAHNVWKRMLSTNSVVCRECHSGLVDKNHPAGEADNCMTCHMHGKPIAHARTWPIRSIKALFPQVESEEWTPSVTQ